MADNVVDLIVDIKLEGKKELKTYTKELKTLVKVLKEINKSSFKEINKSLKDQKKYLKETGTETKKLVKENNNLASSMKKATTENKKFNKSLKNTEQNANDSSFALNKVSLGVAAGVAGIVAWTNATVQSNIQLQQQARLAGLSVARFEEWAFAAKTVGVSADQMADAFNEIGLKSQDALQEKSGGFFDQLNKLNIDIKEFTKLDPAAQFEALGDAISGLNAQEQKFALDEIASDSGIQTQAVLENIVELKERIKEVRALGGFVSPEQRQSITDLNKDFATFTQLLGTSSTKAFSAFSPFLKEIVTDMTHFLGLLNKANTGELSTLSSGMIRLTGATSAVYNSLALLVDFFETLGTLAGAAFDNLVNSIRFRVEQIKLMFEALPGAIINGFVSIADTITEIFSAVVVSIVEGFGGLLEKIGVDIDVSSVREKMIGLVEAQKKLFEQNNGDILQAEKELNDKRIENEQRYQAKRALIAANTRVNLDKREKEAMENLVDFMDGLTAAIDPEFSAATNEDFKNQITKPVEEGVEEAKNEATRGFSEVKQEIEAQLAEIEKAKILLELEVGGISKEEYDKLIKEITGNLEGLYTEQSKLTTKEQERIEAETKALEIQKTRTELLKKQSPLYVKELKAKEEVLKAEIELAKLQGDALTVIEKSLELSEFQINSNIDLTDEVKNQQIAMERKLSAQEKINLESKKELEIIKKAGIEADKAEKKAKEKAENRKDALKDIRDLQNDLLDLQGKRTDLDKLKTLEEDALAAVDADETIDLDLKNKQKGLIKEIYDEKAVKAQFQTILDEYLDLLDQFKSATTIGEQNEIEGQINEKQSELESFAESNNLNPENMRALTEATNEWAETLSITDEKLQGLAETLGSTVASSLTEVAQGTKSWGEAFQDVAAVIIKEIIAIGVEMLALAAIEAITSAFGGGGGGGIGGAIASFHEGGGINDAMIQTRSIDQEMRADELPAIIKSTEEVVSKNKLNQMRASGGGGTKVNLNNNIVLDPADVVNQAAKTDEWNENLMSFMKSNSNELKQIIS